MGGMGSLAEQGHIGIEARRSTERGEVDALMNKIAAEGQAGMRPMLKASMLVTTGIIPTHIAAQTLVG